MMADGVFIVDGDSFTQIGFIPTGVGAHGLYPSRDGTKLYVANRGSNTDRRRTRTARAASRCSTSRPARSIGTWPIPGGGSPDMGNVSADGNAALALGPLRRRRLRLRHDHRRVCSASPSAQEPHGLTVWPQPGRYSLGHTGNMR